MFLTEWRYNCPANIREHQSGSKQSYVTSDNTFSQPARCMQRSSAVYQRCV